MASYFFSFSLLLIGVLYMFNIRKIDGAIRSVTYKAEKITQSLPLHVQWVIVITSVIVLLIELLAA